MKTNQAWGWLAAGVLAAGLNANYYDGGLQCAHRVADRVGQNSAAVLARASGRADQFLNEARVLAGRDQAPSCPLATTLARVQDSIGRSFGRSGDFAVMSARQEAQIAKFEANRERMEAKVAAQTSHFRFAGPAFATVAFKGIPSVGVCPRIRVNVPKIPMIKMPGTPNVVGPNIHVEIASNGPV